MAVIHYNGQKIIVSVEADGAAYHAGILPGDVIEELNGRLAADEDMHQLRQLFTSVAGDELELKVLRKDRHISTTLILEARTPTALYQDK
jgi:S1-C subfamily serine protease